MRFCDLQGVENVEGYIPDARWYDFNTVSRSTTPGNKH